MPKSVSREVADVARERAAKGGTPTVRDRELADVWYPEIVAGRLTKHDLALLLTSIRFDAALVRRLEQELERERHGVRGVRKAKA